MGLLAEGKPLVWEDVEIVSDFVRKQATLQFINHFNRHKDRKHDPYKWGDEVRIVFKLRMNILSHIIIIHSCLRLNTWL